ncbi:hypothetical protein NDU88_003494 [Pleurodeles waltl]|uniref:Uncharacterized protein n=1 Tax=Pleurodeles waltl TaxID=8319 RepID=A0AAV7WP80_PLEWA|nr:hypothetical protein NDU88_003494 [Pleurodeles waltl]
MQLQDSAGQGEQPLELVTAASHCNQYGPGKARKRRRQPPRVGASGLELMSGAGLTGLGVGRAASVLSDGLLRSAAGGTKHRDLNCGAMAQQARSETRPEHWCGW